MLDMMLMMVVLIVPQSASLQINKPMTAVAAAALTPSS
jgi:hypothetical protein